MVRTAGQTKQAAIISVRKFKVGNRWPCYNKNAIRATTANIKQPILYCETRDPSSLGRVADDVVLDGVVSTANRHPDAVLVVREGVVANVGIKRLQHGEARVAVVVDVVACNPKNKVIHSSKDKIPTRMIPTSHRI